MEKKRVVVTGAGVVSALGNRRDELFDSLAAGKSAARYMPEWQSFFGKINIAAAPVTLDQEAVKKIDRRFRRSRVMPHCLPRWQLSRRWRRAGWMKLLFLTAEPVV